MCALAFFVRDLGIVQTRCARSSSSHGQTGDFLAALSGERQELDNTTIRSANLSSGEDDLGELLVVQHSVASDFLRGQWHPFGWGLIKDGSTHAPAQERLDRLQGLVGGDRVPRAAQSLRRLQPHLAW